MKRYLLITSFFGAFTILLGALGTHFLKDALEPKMLESFITAVRYQMYHVIVLLIINLSSKFENQSKKMISNIWLLGISLFSGSIYAITIFGVSAKYIWFLTPIGGLLFVVGWIIMGVSFYKTKKVG